MGNDKEGEGDRDRELRLGLKRFLLECGLARSRLKKDNARRKKGKQR